MIRVFLCSSRDDNERYQDPEIPVVPQEEPYPEHGVAPRQEDERYENFGYRDTMEFITPIRTSSESSSTSGSGDEAAITIGKLTSLVCDASLAQVQAGPPSVAVSWKCALSRCRP